MQNNNTSTTLYHRNKHDTCWIWRVWTEGADVVTEYGTVLGKRQQSRFTCETKNPGKANETTPEDQAVLEMESLIRYKLDKKYKKTLEETEEFTFGAMLASSKQFTDYKDKLEFPIYIQKKLNGCLEYNTLIEFEDGRILPIGYVVENLIPGKIKSYNINTMETMYKNITNFMKNYQEITDNCQWFEIELENGSKIKCTGNHQFYIDGSWIRADQLKINDEVLYDNCIIANFAEKRKNYHSIDI